MVRGKTMKTQFGKIISLIITLITLVVGAVLWATGAHADNRSEMAERDNTIKLEMREENKDKYARNYEFSAVQAKLDAHEKQHEILIRTLENMDRKIDKLSTGRRGYRDSSQQP